MKKYFVVILLMILFTFSCSSSRAERKKRSKSLHAEVLVEEIQLTGPVRKSRTEVSGMTWYKDYLIILPQYPGRIKSKNQGKLFYIAKETILQYLNNPDHREPIKPKKIELIAPGLEDKIPGYEGFESIAFSGNRVFLTIESNPPDNDMLGFLITGTISTKSSSTPKPHRITLDVPDQLTEIPSQADVNNFTDEAILVTSDHVITVYEGNGKKINPRPVAHVFDHNLKLIKTIPFPTIEYRITDATIMDKDGKFWAINYFFPGTRKKVKPGKDKIAKRHGRGETHHRSKVVERLVQLQYTGMEINLLEQPPVQFQLEELPRNWEGVVQLESRGFLVITDEHPRTILGFVKIN